MGMNVSVYVYKDCPTPMNNPPSGKSRHIDPIEKLSRFYICEEVNDDAF